MNISKKVKEDSAIVDKVGGFKYCLYCFMLISVEELDMDRLLYYTVPVDSLKSSFKYVGHKEVLKAIEELVKEGLIVLSHDGYVQVGFMKGELPCLLGTVEDTDKTEESFSALLSAADSYIADSPAGGISYAKAKRIKAEIQAFLAVKFEDYTTRVLAQLWRLSFAAFFQEESRELLGKEAGQLKTLLRLYDAEVVVQLMIYYLGHADKYTKSFPTIGQLLAYKDTILSAMKGGAKPKKSKSYMRTETHSEF